MLAFAKEEGIEVLGEIPYDESAMQALFSAQPLTRLPEHALKAPMESIWAQLKKRVSVIHGNIRSGPITPFRHEPGNQSPAAQGMQLRPA